MTALTADYEVKRKDGQFVSYKVAAAETIYKGALVFANAAGYLYPAEDTASTVYFVGVAIEQGDNSSGANGAISIRVNKIGTYEFAKASAVVGDIGSLVYARDDQTVATSTTNSISVGYVVEIPDSSHVQVRIDTVVK